MRGSYKIMRVWVTLQLLELTWKRINQSELYLRTKDSNIEECEQWSLTKLKTQQSVKCCDFLRKLCSLLIG